MSASPIAIQYEKQLDPQTNRGCGAACLSMVYRSLGKEVPQAEIWPAIAKQNRFGSIASTTYLMAQDASKRGFASVALQARHPLQVLRLCRDAGIRAILNHRSQQDSASGHYSVFVDLDEKSVVLHDPFVGPSRRVPNAELLELWQPRVTNSEIIGNMMIAIAGPATPAIPVCEFCHTPIPPKVDCPRCKQPIGLRPQVPLGCVNNACIARMWNYICCPMCDYTWNFSMEPGQSATAPGSSPDKQTDANPAKELVSLTEVFAELDKFCNYVLSVPAAAGNPDIKAQLDLIAVNREKLSIARAEGLANLKVHQVQMDALANTAKKNEAAHKEKLDALNKPAPKLDGDALGHALLKNFGFQ
jgi:hypothetical protein